MVENRLRHVTVVGTSIAGLTAAQSLRSQGFEGGITLFGDEPIGTYQRPALSKRFLTDDSLEVADIRMRWDVPDLIFELNVRATHFDLTQRQLTLCDQATGRTYNHSVDGLIIASGATARKLPGDTPSGVYTLRTMEDALNLRQDLKHKPRVAIVGAGYDL